MAASTMINSAIYILLLLLLLLITTSSASPLSFNLSTIGPDNANREILLQGDAYISREGLQVTTDESSRLSALGTGRATYADSLHLWDNATGNLTDFDTHFSFVIRSTNPNCAADGLAFFLAPVNSTIPENSSGAGLGLAFNNATANVSVAPFVAVEFDTFTNNWDPIGPHVGIDVRSLISAEWALWRNNLTVGRITEAWISYRSSSKRFVVNFTNFVNQTTQFSSIEYTVDLRNFMPEFVTVGFSAATGDCFQTNTVKSWSFNSTLDLKIPDTPPPVVVGPDPKPGSKPVGLVAGLSTAAAVGLVLVGYWLWKRRRGERKDNEEGDEEKDDEDVSSMEMDFEKGNGPRRFSYRELAAATDNFAEECKLGEGGFGGVYRGFLKNLDSHVAVKRVSKTSKQGAKEYASEVKIISRLRHRYKRKSRTYS